MEVRSKYESPLVLEKIEIVESSFRKKTDSLDSLELGVQVERNLTKLDDGLVEVYWKQRFLMKRKKYLLM